MISDNKCVACGESASTQSSACPWHPVVVLTGYAPNKADNTGRPSWDATWLEFAQVMSRRSRCSRSQVGAVIVAADQTVVSTGYNGPPRGFEGEGSCINWCPRARGDAPPNPTYDDCPSAHAEANAIARADYSRMQGATIYVSTSCCKGCAKLLANSGIVRVVFKHEDGRDYRNSEATVDFLGDCGIKVDIYE